MSLAVVCLYMRSHVDPTGRKGLKVEILGSKRGFEPGDLQCR